MPGRHETKGWTTVQIARDLHEELARFARELEDADDRDSRRRRVGIAEAARIAIRRGIEITRERRAASAEDDPSNG